MFRSGLLQSLFDFGVRIGGFGINLLLLCGRLAKAHSARGCHREGKTRCQNSLGNVHTLVSCKLEAK
jgi:hypothetical protein